MANVSVIQHYNRWTVAGYDHACCWKLLIPNCGSAGIYETYVSDDTVWSCVMMALSWEPIIETYKLHNIASVNEALYSKCSSIMSVAAHRVYDFFLVEDICRVNQTLLSEICPFQRFSLACRTVEPFFRRRHISRLVTAGACRLILLCTAPPIELLVEVVELCRAGM